MNKFTLLLWLALITTVELWILAKTSIGEVASEPLRSITQITALLGAVGYFVTFILSSRLPFIEKELPLDKAYRLHRLVGTIAGSGILLHITSLIANILPSSAALRVYLIPGSNLAYTLGIFAFYLLILMLFSTLYLRLPYHIWKVVHKATSYSIMFATLHIFLIPSDVSTYLPLRAWILGIATLAIIAWFYRQFLYSRSAFTHEYSVESIETSGDINIVRLRAKMNPLQCTPGQFAFFKFLQKKKGPGSEVHPFTILYQTPDTLTIAVKALGDTTKKFSLLVPGTRVLVAGPHGSFGTKILNERRPSIWIAGGIGITPFYHVISNLAAKGGHKDARLYYSTTIADELFHPKLRDNTARTGIEYFYRSTNIAGRLSANDLLAQLKQPANAYSYFLCGPNGLIESTVATLRHAGVPKRQIITEDFDFISLSLT